jgi:hypothetical protein
MTPNQIHLAKQASTELGSTKLLTLTDQLCRAIDAEQEVNRPLRLDCREDCQEHCSEVHLPIPLVAALPENVTRVVRWA